MKKSLYYVVTVNVINHEEQKMQKKLKNWYITGWSPIGSTRHYGHQ
jgi:hypothetical protein